MHERRAAGPAGRGYPGPLDAGLSGTGLVADDLYLLAHDDRSGKPLLPPRPLGTGLAGALLTELVLACCVGLRPDTAVVIGQAVPRTAVYGHVLLKQIADEPSPLPVRAWLLYLARTAAGDVALRLEQAGYLARVRSRIPGRDGRSHWRRGSLFNFHRFLRANATVCPIIEVTHLVEDKSGEHQQNEDHNNLRPRALLLSKRINEVTLRARRQSRDSR